MVTTTEHVKESTHWYTKTGEAAYTVTGKNGQERNTTLKDARKLGLVPSVTTIIGEANKYGLNKWIQEQVLLAALTLPRIDGEPEQEYINRIITDSQEQAKKARERGTQIHAWVQQGFECLWGEIEGEPFDYYVAARTTLELEFGEKRWLCETPFSYDRYGGKVDLHLPREYWGNGVSPDFTYGAVIDIKTTDKPLANLKTWDEHAMQLSAYREGLGLPNAQCGILYVCTKGVDARLVWIEEKDLLRGWNMFQGLLDYWYAKTGL